MAITLYVCVTAFEALRFFVYWLGVGGEMYILRRVE